MRAEDSFGFLTLAHDAASVRRARALARSLRRHEPGAPVALLAVCPLPVRPAEFDTIVEVPLPEPFVGAYRFFNKLVALGSCAPFARNFFLDDDVIVLGPVRPMIEERFAGRPFALNCDRRAPAEAFQGPNHLDPSAVAEELRVSTVMDPYGGGHLYFERPACEPFFRAAIELVLFEPQLYRRLSGDGFLSDELALTIVAHRNGLEMPSLDGWIDPLDRSRAESIELDIERDVYRFPARDRGADERARLLHFCADGKTSRSYRRAVATLLGEAEEPGGSRLRALFRRAT